jgi:hypothetical protein
MASEAPPQAFDDSNLAAGKATDLSSNRWRSDRSKPVVNSSSVLMVHNVDSKEAGYELRRFEPGYSKIEAAEDE